MSDIIKEAVKICGSQQKLATKCNVSQQAVGAWVRKKKGIKAKYLQAISDATNNQITVEQLVKALDHRNDNRR